MDNGRTKCLTEAEKIVNNDRQNNYGTPEDNFGCIANYWSVFLGRTITPADVATMMILVKAARLKTSPRHGDNWIDIAGYAACGYELTGVDND